MSHPGLTNTSARAIQHRLPTVSASDALKKAAQSTSFVSTGSQQIDELLEGGLATSKVTEIHGPPGSGKTSLAISAAATVIRAGGAVAWIDGGFRVSPLQIAQAIGNSQESGLKDEEARPEPKPKAELFHHYETPALAHLLSLLLHRSADFPRAGTRLLVLESASMLFGSAFPSNYQPSNTTNAKETPQQWAASRRWALQREVVSALSKLAAVHDMAVLVTCQMATRFDREAMGPGKPKAMLRPSLNTKSWTDGLWARLLLFRHWGPQLEDSVNTSDEALQRNLNRFAGLAKLGSTEYDICGRFVPFRITKDGIRDPQQSAIKSTDDALARPFTGPAVQAPGPTGAKRHVAEIADSESDEDEFDLTRALDEDEVQELNENGLTREEQAMLELEIEAPEMETSADFGTLPEY